MHHAYSTRGQILAMLMFCVPLAIAGFQAAGGWGVLAGVLVGAVIATRMLLRGVVETPAVQSHALIVTGSETNPATYHADVIAPKSPVLH